MVVQVADRVVYRLLIAHRDIFKPGRLQLSEDLARRAGAATIAATATPKPLSSLGTSIII
jgi:hypothetical protein